MLVGLASLEYFFFFFFIVFCPHFVIVSVFYSFVNFFFFPVSFRFEQHEKGVVHGRVGLVKTSEIG